MKKSLLTVAASMLGLALVLSPMAEAVELKVLAGGSMTGPLNQLGPEFERVAGHKLTFHFDSTPNLIKQITTGVPFDVVVVPVDVFRDAAAKAQFASAGTVVEVASVGYGIAVRAGAPKPDISTPDALKRILLGAQSIAFVPASAAGAYILKVFERLDIAEAMKAKTVPQTTPSAIAPAVAKGEAELAVFLTNVLFAPGVELVGPFPPDLQQELVFWATIAANTKEADAATAFVNYLRTPAAIAVIKAAGMNPGKRGTY